MTRPPRRHIFIWSPCPRDSRTACPVGMLAGLVPIANPARRAAPSFWAAVAGLQRAPFARHRRRSKSLILKNDPVRKTRNFLARREGTRRESGPAAPDSASAQARPPAAGKASSPTQGAKNGFHDSARGRRRETRRYRNCRSEGRISQRMARLACGRHAMRISRSRKRSGEELSRYRIADGRSRGETAMARHRSGIAPR